MCPCSFPNPWSISVKLLEKEFMPLSFIILQQWCTSLVDKRRQAHADTPCTLTRCFTDPCFFNTTCLTPSNGCCPLAKCNTAHSKENKRRFERLLERSSCGGLSQQIRMSGSWTPNLLGWFLNLLYGVLNSLYPLWPIYTSSPIMVEGGMIEHPNSLEILIELSFNFPLDTMLDLRGKD